MLMGIESLELKVSFSQKFLLPKQILWQIFYCGPNRALSFMVETQRNMTRTNIACWSGLARGS